LSCHTTKLWTGFQLFSLVMLQCCLFSNFVSYKQVYLLSAIFLFWAFHFIIWLLSWTVVYNLHFCLLQDESNLYIFIELVSKGSLLSLYQRYKLRDSQVSAYTRQILQGLKYLHDCNIVHRWSKIY
jgi:serine/threonine protein kinase